MEIAVFPAANLERTAHQSYELLRLSRGTPA